MSAVVLFGLLSIPAPAQASLGDDWQVADIIESNSGYSAYYPQVAVSSNGNATAVWMQSDGLVDHIWANYFVPGVGWDVATLIETSSWDANWPDVAMDPMGNALAVWQLYDGAYSHLWANRYVAGAGWGVAEALESVALEDSLTPVVAMDGFGNGLVLWAQGAAAPRTIQSCYYYFQSKSWQGILDLENDITLGDATVPQVGFDSTGNAVAVWIQYDGARTSTYANLWTKTPTGGTWGTAGTIDGSDVGHTEASQVAVQPNGRAIAVWLDADPTYHHVRVNHFVPPGTWEGDMTIENIPAYSSASPEVSVDSNGNAIVVWIQYDGAHYNVMANRIAGSETWAAGSWDELVVLETRTESANNPVVAMDASGTAIAVWWQGGPTSTQTSIWSNRYVVGQGWETAVVIEKGNFNAQVPRISMDANGNAVCVWHQYDNAVWNVWANRYVAPDLTAPILTMVNPIDLSTTDIPVVLVSGATEPGAKLAVNGMLADVAADGSFSLKVGLSEGLNTITVIATDAAGNAVTASRTVTFSNPVSALQAQVAQIASDLATVWDQANATQTSLTALGTEVSTLGSELTALQAQVSTLGSELTALQAQVSALRTQLTTAYAGLNSSQTQVTAALSDINALETQLDALQTQLGATRTALNTTQTDLNDVQDDVNGRATSSSPMMWGIIAIVVSVIAAVALTMVLGKKKP